MDTCASTSKGVAVASIVGEAVSVADGKRVCVCGGVGVDVCARVRVSVYVGVSVREGGCVTVCDVLADLEPIGVGDFV